jgi:hypothetical protein
MADQNISHKTWLGHDWRKQTAMAATQSTDYDNNDYDDNNNKNSLRQSKSCSR